jgi:hypothetical protein
MESHFVLQALEQLRWINWHLSGATESERQALIEARTELMKLIASVATRKT